MSKIRNLENGNPRTLPISWQYDYGQKLTFNGFDLPDGFEVHFSCSRDEPAIVTHGVNNSVDIPDELLSDGRPVLGWVFIRGEVSGSTICEFEIPVSRRPRREG